MNPALKKHTLSGCAGIRIAAITAVTILLWSGYAYAREREVSSVEMQARIFEAFAAGDYYALHDEIERFVLAYPDSPESALYIPDLGRLSDVRGREHTKRTLERLLRLLESSAAVHKNLYALKVRLELEKLIAVDGRKEMEKFSSTLKPLRRWSLMGPYHRLGAADLEYSYLPEIIRRLDDPSVRRRAIVSRRPDGGVHLDEYLYPRKGVAYAISTIRPSGAVRIRVYSSCSYRLFVNGREALRNAPDGVFRNCRVLRARAEGGVTIMMKVFSSKNWDFRILVTDDSDVPLEIESRSDEMSFSECEVQELYDFPHEVLVGRIASGKAEGHFMAGNYFHELESAEALRFYERAASIEKSATHRYFLGQCMIEQSGGVRDSALFMEGWRILRECAAEHKTFIPGLHKAVQGLMEQRRYLEACEAAEGLLRQAPRCLPLHLDLSKLYAHLEYEKEFVDEIERFRREFPRSSLPLQVQAEYFQKRDPARCAGLCAEILKMGYDRRTLEMLIALEQQRQSYAAVLDLIAGHGAIEDFKKDYIDTLILSGDYRRAKEALFKHIVERDDPAMYLRIGLIAYLSGDDPSMNWRKALSLDPSNFSIGDLLNALASGRLEHPFSALRAARGEEYVAGGFSDGGDGDSYRVLFRGSAILLNRDGSSRAFNEEVVHIRDQRGMERWGEYRVALRGAVRPVRVRVYQRDGSYTDSERVENINGTSYITLSNLREDSIAHIAYYVDNPFPLPGNSGFVSIPFTQIQDFDEPVKDYALRIIAPREMELNFCTSRGLRILTEKLEDSFVYSIRMRDLPPVSRESFAGNSLNYLPFYAVTSMKDLRELSQWYGGIVRDSFRRDLKPAYRHFSGKTAGELVRRVYEFVSRDVDLSGTLPYYPDRAQDTEYRMRGTAEDKAILARSLLSEAGVRSYMALARPRDLPDIGDFVSPDVYTHVLVYVPLSRENALWLDFSKQFNGCGIVDEAIEGSMALVLVGDRYELKEVRGFCLSGLSADYLFNLDSKGNARCELEFRFYGGYGDLRNSFRNTQTREEMIHSYFGEFIPSLGIDTYAIENCDTWDSPLAVKLKGDCFALTPAPADTLILQPLLNRSGLGRYIASHARTQPLHIESPVNESERYTFVLPKDFASSEYESKLHLSCSFGYASVSIKKTGEGRNLVVEKEVHVNAARIETAQYDEFLDFCLRLKAAEEQVVILER